MKMNDWKLMKIIQCLHIFQELKACYERQKASKEEDSDGKTL